MNKKNFILVFFLAFASLTYAQEVNYQLSSHILDITQGQPASGVTIQLSKMNDKDNWVKIDKKVTDKNGRIKDFLKQDKGSNHQGIYKLTYFTKPYFDKMGEKTFYPFIEVVFELKGDSHYHVPITLSPFGYSTYRGN